MKKVVSLLLTVVFVLTVLYIPTFAAGDFEFTLSSDNSYYILKSYTGNAAEVAIPSAYNNLPVKTIGDAAFSGNVSTYKIIIPSSVTSIAATAFCGTPSLNEFEASGSFTAVDGVLFSSDKKTLIAFPQGREGSYVLGSTVERIGEYSFFRSSLSSVGFNSKITSIPAYAFYGAELTEITLPANIKTVSEYAFSGSLIQKAVVSGNTELNGYVFSYCKKLVYADITSASLAGNGVFCGCVSLYALKFPANQNNVPEYSFAGCTNMITAPTGNAGSVSDNAFYGCAALKNVYLKSGATVSVNAFDNCDGLGDIKYGAPDGITSGSLNYTMKVNGEITPDIECAGGYDIFPSSSVISIENGKIKGKREGSAELYAVARKGGSCIVISITVSDGAAVLETPHPYKKGTVVYSKTVSGASRIAVTFSSSFSLDPNDTLTVTDASGNVYGRYSQSSLSGKTLFIDGNKVDLTLDAQVGGKYGFRAVSVKNAADLTKMTAISMPAAREINVGETVSLNAAAVPSDAFPSEIICVSSDSSVAVTDANGSVTGLNGGTAVITAYSSAYGVSASCTVTVKENVYNGLVYEINGNEAYISYYKGARKDCVIPSVINGYTVTKILAGAFAFSDIKTVTIPKTLTSIDISAFIGCSSMTAFNVEAGNSVYSSCEGALTNYSGMILIKVPCGLRGSYKIPDPVNFVGINAFDHCYYINSIDINKAANFSASSTKYCSSLVSFSCSGAAYKAADGVLYSSDNKTLVAYPPAKATAAFSIPEGTEKIGESAFNSCIYLDRITIPATVTNINDRAFLYDNSISDFSVSSKNTHFYAFEGILYEGSTVKSVPSSASGIIKLKNGTENIGNYAFYGCKRITSVILPEGLTGIGKYAFAECSSLEILIYPETVALTEAGAYSGCDKLSVYIPDGYTLEYAYGCRILCTKGSGAEHSCISNGSDYSYAYVSSDDGVICVSECDVIINIEQTGDINVISDIDVRCAATAFDTYLISFIHNGNSVSCGKTYLIDTNGTFDEDTFMLYNGALTSFETDNGVYMTDSDLILAVYKGEDQTADLLSVRKLPDKTEYDVDEEIDLTGIEVYYTSPEGRTTVITDGFEAEYDFSSSGAKTVKIRYGNATATFKVTVRNNKLTGTVSISGACAYGSTVKCDISGLKPVGATVSYQWYSNGKAVSGATSSSYTIKATDISKSITVTVTGTGDYTGSVTSAAVTATKATADPPPKPKALLVTATTVTLESVPGCEYRLSGQSSYSESTVFSGLTPGRNYTFYQRKKETDTHFASERTSLTIKMPENDKLASDVYRLNSTNGILSLAEPLTSVDDFINNFKIKDNISVYKNGSKLSGSALVGTGVEVRLYDGSGNVLDSYTVAITGDVNGDGKISMTDYLQIKERIIKNKVLNKANEYACDVNGDGKITMTDYLRLKYCIQGHENLVQNEY